jgi:hypothetical protein
MRIGIVIAMLTVLIASNLVEFYPIETTRDPEMDAIRIHDADNRDLLEVGLAESSNVRRWFSSHAAVGALAPDSTILLPADAPFASPRITSSLYGFGDAADVRKITFRETYDTLDEVLNAAGRQALASEVVGSFATGPGKTRFAQWILLIDRSNATSTDVLVGFSFEVDGEVIMALVDQRLVSSSVEWDADA